MNIYCLSDLLIILFLFIKVKYKNIFKVFFYYEIIYIKIIIIEEIIYYFKKNIKNVRV